MKKAIFVVIAFLLVAAAMIPAYADVTSRAWLGTTFTGNDGYYGDGTIYAYTEGTTAVLAVTVQNPNATALGRIGLNITSVYVTFDWGTTYTSSLVSSTNYVVLQPQEYHIFTISFTVPNVTIASNLYRHSYTIYAGYAMKNASSTTQWLTGKWTLSPKDPTTNNPDFVVYSTDQAGAMDLARIIDNSSPPSGGWTSAKAKILWNEAENETGSGQAYYTEGDFTRAQQRFSAALSDINSAWSAEQDYTIALEDLQIGQLQAEINGMNAWASFLNGFSTLWVLIGIGWVLLGIGYIIKWLRTKRPEYVYPAPAPAAQA